MNIEILVLQLGLHKTSENILISPPAMLFTQLGLQEGFISNLSGHYLVFNNTTKEFASGKKKGGYFNSKMCFMNNFQTPPKHEGILGSYSPCFILFLIDSSNYKIMPNLWVFMLETSRMSLTGALLANRTNLWECRTSHWKVTPINLNSSAKPAHSPHMSQDWGQLREFICIVLGMHILYGKWVAHGPFHSS